MQRDFLSSLDSANEPPVARYCSHCGASAENKFCSRCGQPLAASPAAPGGDWRQLICFEEVVRAPEARARIQAGAARSRKRLSGEEFLAMAGSVMSIGVPLDKLAGVVQPLYASWGVKTGKEQRQRVHAPPGETLVRVLCSLAERGQELRQVQQADDACTLVATFPSDLLALEGRLLVTVERAAEGSHVVAATKIEGQAFDWGKSRRGLERLFTDLQRAA